MKHYDDNGEVSEWNEAMFKMKRLHELQVLMNNCKIDPFSKLGINNLGFNPNDHKYKIWFLGATALYHEGDCKYSLEERKDVELLKKTIEDFLETFPITIRKKRLNNRGYDDINMENWKHYRILMESYDKKIRYLNDKHGLGTKNQESMDGRSILR